MKKLMFFLILILLGLESEAQDRGKPIRPYNEDGYTTGQFKDFALENTSLSKSYRTHLLRIVNNFLEETNLLDSVNGGKPLDETWINWIFYPGRTWVQNCEFPNGYMNSRLSEDENSVEFYWETKYFNSSCMVLHLYGYELILAKNICMNLLDIPFEKVYTPKNGSLTLKQVVVIDSIIYRTVSYVDTVYTTVWIEEEINSFQTEVYREQQYYPQSSGMMGGGMGMSMGFGMSLMMVSLPPQPNINITNINNNYNYNYSYYYCEHEDPTLPDPGQGIDPPHDDDGGQGIDPPHNNDDNNGQDPSRPSTEWNQGQDPEHPARGSSLVDGGEKNTGVDKKETVKDNDASKYKSPKQIQEEKLSEQITKQNSINDKLSASVRTTTESSNRLSNYTNDSKKRESTKTSNTNNSNSQRVVQNKKNSNNNSNNQRTYSQPSNNQRTYSQPSNNQRTYSQPSNNQRTYSQPSNNQKTSSRNSNHKTYSRPSMSRNNGLNSSPSRSSSSGSYSSPSRSSSLGGGGSSGGGGYRGSSGGGNRGSSSRGR